MGDNEGGKVENTFVPSADGSDLDREAKEQHATKEATKAVEGPPRGARCMPSKDNLAQSQQTFKSTFSRMDVETQETANVKTSPKGPGPPHGFNVIRWKATFVSYLACWE